MKAPQNQVEVHGLVVSAVDVGERDRLISLFTAEMGLIVAYANGARQLKNRYMAATQQFCYGRYQLGERVGRYTVQDVELAETFYDLRADIGRASLASYLCEVVSYTGTEQPEPQTLRLTLNALFAISRGLYPLPLIKAAFEFRVASDLGFMPDMDRCAVCGRESGDFILHIPQGHLICDGCRDSAAEREEREEHEGRDRDALALLTPAVREAIRYVIHVPGERLFSFRLEEDDMRLFSHAAEDYLLWHVDRTFASLAFYKQMTD